MDEAQTMFTREDILNELLSSGGRMLNSQLVLRFAKYLKNPATKEEAKAKFKDYVNKLATLVTDADGAKFVVLRPEISEMRSLPRVKPVAPQPPQNNQKPQHRQHVPPPQRKAERTPTGVTGPVPGRPPRQPPAYQHAVSSSKLTRMPPANPTAANPAAEPPRTTQLLQSRPSSLKLIQDNDDLTGGIYGGQRRSSAGAINAQLLQQSGMVIPKGSQVGQASTPPLPPQRSLSKSVPSLLDDMDSPPAVPSRNRRHSTKGTVVEEKVKQFAEKEFVRDDSRTSLTDKTSVAVSPGTVKEKVQMLKMTSEGNLVSPQMQLPLRSASSRDSGRRALSSRNSNPDSDDKCSVSTLDPLRKEFCRIAMTCDYQAMQKILKEDPSLAKAIDYVLGYNALHWAAKYGNSDIVKLIAGTYNVDPNIKTRGSGQTPLHIAYMFNQNAIIDLLILTYNAEREVYDFNGKKAEFYGTKKNVDTLRSKVYNKEKHLDKTDDVTFAKPEPKPFAKRYGSFNVNIKKTLHHLNLKNWDGLGGVEEEPHSLPSLSRGGRKMPKRAKRTASLLSSVSGRSSSNNVVIEEKQHDSDSDSAYGFNA